MHWQAKNIEYDPSRYNHSRITTRLRTNENQYPMIACAGLNPSKSMKRIDHLATYVLTNQQFSLGARTCFVYPLRTVIPESADFDLAEGSSLLSKNPKSSCNLLWRPLPTGRVVMV